MGCEHAETTTLLWLYGEGDPAHATHVAECEACQAVVAEHEAVLGALVTAATLPRAPEIPEPANRPWIRWVAVAAAVLVAVLAGWIAGTAPPPEEAPAVAVVAPEPVDPWTTDLDRDLDTLDAELDALAVDLYTL